MPKYAHHIGEDLVVVHALPPFSRNAVAAFEEFTESDSIFGLDVETTAIEDSAPFDPEMKTRLIQFGNRFEAWVFDPDSKWREVIERFLRKKTVRFVSHNAAYDTTRVWFRYDLRLGDRSIDTLPMASLRFPGRTAPVKMSRGLKELCAHYFDYGLLNAEYELYSDMADMYAARTAKLPKSFVPGVGACRRPKEKNKDKCTNVSFEESRAGYCREHWFERGKKLANSKPKVPDNAKAWGWNNIPLDNDRYLKYGGLDAIYVRRLLDVLSEELKTFKMNALSKTEQRISRLMTDTSIRGHRVDIEWTDSLVADIGDEFNDAAETIELWTGIGKPGSPKLIAWFNDNGVKTKSLDKDHLEELLLIHGKRQDTVGDVLRAKATCSKNSNILSNLRTIQEHARRFGGFTHAQINTLQAHTGRMSVTGPAMQTFKKTDRRLRGCYIARDGFVFVGADYNSQEIRIAAAESRDPALLRIVSEGLNQHVLTAMSIFADIAELFEMCPNGGCGECEACSAAKKKFPEAYAAAKVLDFAQQYGAGPRRIALQLGVSLQEAKAMWLAWRHTYAGLVAWSERMAGKVRVRNAFGRSIPADPFRSYANGNYVIQSTGRDILGAALCRLADAGWADYFWLPVHDELVMEVPEKRAEEAAEALTLNMSTTHKGIEIPAEGEILGTRWGGMAA